MRGVFDDEEFEPAQQSDSAEQRRDTVLTLGPMVAIGLFLILAILCGMSFAAGYIVGHRAPQPPPAAANESSDKQKLATVNAAKAKPAPAGQNSQGKEQGSGPVRQSAAPPEQPAEINRAKDAAARPADSGQPEAASNGWMVQIAAVSHQEDAQVLEGALRKRGYAVTLSRDAADNLIHVRIGPFTNRDEAAKWRQKLLNDGYNAMLQP
jgi:cell division septation protein DedD